MTGIKRCNKNDNSDYRVAESRSYCYSKDRTANYFPGAVNETSEKDQHRCQEIHVLDMVMEETEIGTATVLKLICKKNTKPIHKNL